MGMTHEPATHIIGQPESKICETISYLQKWKEEEESLRVFFLFNKCFTKYELIKWMGCEYTEAVECMARLFVNSMIELKGGGEYRYYKVTNSFFNLLHLLFMNELEIKGEL